MNGKWPDCSLDDLTDEILDRRGITPKKLQSKFIDSGHRVISAKLIKGGTINLSADEPRYVDAQTYKRWMSSPLQAGDVILTSEAPLGETAYINQTLEWCLGQRLFAIRTKKDLLSGRFLYYALRHAPVRNDLLSRATGTTAQGIRQSELRRVMIPVPPLEEQRAIAHILGALDDKIELNRQMNRTLDEIARTLFTSWFVNFDPVRAKAEGRQPEGVDAETAALFPDRFVDSELGPIPEGWEVKTLGDIATNIRDNVSASELNPEDDYVGLEHLPKRHIGLSEWSTAEEVSSNKSKFIEGDILFGKLRPYFHKVVVAPISGVSSTDILIIRPKEYRHAALTLCATSSDQMIALADTHSSGTRMPRAKWTDLSSFQITLPTNEAIIDAFATAIDPMIRMINHNVHESRTLAGLRDTLLPELLSGRIQVALVGEVV